MTDTGADDEQEEDYMSLSFIVEAAKVDKKRDKFRNKNSRKRKRKADIVPRKSKRQRMKDSLEQGLKTEIPSDNVGFKLLEKMGYKKGMCLGKNEQGIAKPVEVRIRARQKGLGQDRKEKEEQIKREEEKIQLKELAKRIEINSKSNFRQQVSERFVYTKLKRHLQKCQRYCKEFDEQAGVPESRLWGLSNEPPAEILPYDPFACLDLQPEDQIEHHNTEDEEGHLNLTNKDLLLDKPYMEAQIRELLPYLRDVHKFCVFCGIQYKSKEEMIKSCPGQTESVHEKLTDF